MQTPESSFPPATVPSKRWPNLLQTFPKELSPQVLGVSWVIMGSELGACRVPHMHTALCLPGPHGTDSVPHTGCVELWMHSQSKTVPLMELRARVLGSNPAPTTDELCNLEQVISLCRFLF